MITSELRLGNWVTGRNDSPMQVASISKGTIGLHMPDSEVDNFEYDDKEINPILLTGKILEQCGFMCENMYFLLGQLLIINGDSLEFMYRGSYIEKYPTSLHELQNLYFSLTGQELTFNSELPPTGTIANQA